MLHDCMQVRCLSDVVVALKGAPIPTFDILAHSLGTYVVLKACQEAWPPGVCARNIIFVGADVDATEFGERSPGWKSIKDRCKTFTSYFNKTDYALIVSSVIRLWAPRLGRVGRPVDSDLSQNHVDCTSVFARLGVHTIPLRRKSRILRYAVGGQASPTEALVRLCRRSCRLT